MAYLTTVFKKHIKPKARRNWRLLFIDGYRSYINIRFLNYYIENRIFIAVYLPYTTYRL